MKQNFEEVWTPKKAIVMIGIFTLAENGTWHINNTQTKMGADALGLGVPFVTPKHGCVLS